MAEILQLPHPEDPQVKSSLFSENERVSALIPGGEFLNDMACFGDDIWDLAGHPSWKDKSAGETKLDFRAIDWRWRSSAKELMLFQLDPALAPNRAPEVPMAQTWPQTQEPTKPVTAVGNLKFLRHALRVIDENHMSTFDTNDWERLAVLLVQPINVEEKQSGVVLSTGTGRARAQQLIALWQVTQIGGSNILGPDLPFGGRDTSELFRPNKRSNSVRPHEGVGRVLGFTAWFFDHIAEDIVNHMEWWITNSDAEPPLNRDDLFNSMLTLASQLAWSNGGVLPGSVNQHGEITLAGGALGRLIGVYDADEAYLGARWAMSQLKGTVSLSLDASPCPLPITEVPFRDGSRGGWTHRLIASQDSLDIWQRRLVYFAMYYISATVMLRDQQLAELSIDPLTTEEITRPNGTTYVRHVLHAHRTKNRSAPVPTEVLVNGRIARIVGLLQRMQQLLGYAPRRSSHTGVECLFDQRLVTPFGKKPRTGNRESIYLDLGFLNLMRSGARELYDRGVIARHLDDVSINMQQVRITCAQAYAVREHGQALAAAFGQWDTARVAAGYVGDVYRLITPLDPDETVDLALQDAGRRLRFASQHRDDYRGNGVARLVETIKRNGDAVSNPQPLSAARLRTLGKNNQNIEQGPLSMCIFNSESALCEGKGKADFRLCYPGQCRNSVMSPSDRARYELMRRQNLELKSDVLRRAAQKMHDAIPEITEEFKDWSNEDLLVLIKKHLDEYIQAALEDRG